MDDESVSDVREMFPESELCDERWCRWLMSHGPATGVVIDGAVESLRCRHMSLGSEYMNGPAPRVTLGISGENNWSHRHYHTTRRNV